MSVKQRIKNLLKKYLPLPARKQREIENRLLTELQQIHSENSNLRNEISSLKETISGIQTIILNTNSVAYENVYANVFHDTTIESNWLKDKVFWPGRSALGYPAMYVTYRILNEIKPERILELGLGQSTKLISQYAASKPAIEHTVVESNQDWINFFSKSYNLPENTKIEKLDYKIIPYKNSDVRIFDGFEENFTSKKFDFILIDAPLGVDMKVYSRIDVLNILPECLDDNFIILVDDTERLGETNTLAEIRKVLEANSISFAEGSYGGMKKSTLICSGNLSFLTTL